MSLAFHKVRFLLVAEVHLGMRSIKSLPPRLRSSEAWGHFDSQGPFRAVGFNFAIISVRRRIFSSIARG